VVDERRLEILSRLDDGDGRPNLDTRQLCDLAVELSGTSGAGIMLMSGDAPRGWVRTSDDVSATVEQLQFDLGEGPCIDAYERDWPVYEPDLAHPQVHRWPAFSSAAIEAGVGAIFGFPLQVGAVRLGALNLYRRRPGSLTEGHHADALIMATLIAQALLLLQADAPPGQVAAELAVGADFRYVVHQAAGMVAAQLNVSVGQALVRLRAHAFGNGLSLTDVAEGVVARTMRFDDESRTA
jgi:hypothetical protein